MSTKADTFQLAAEVWLEAICRFLGRDLPPPSGWAATEFRKGSLSVYRVQRGGGIEPANVGKWAVNAGPTPRDPEYFDTAEEARLHAAVLERLESENRA